MLNSAQNQRYLSLGTLKFHGWPWKTIGHLFYATSRFEHRFIAICEFELELQSENHNFGSKSITLKNNRAPLLCYFNLYASFHSYLWIQTGDTVRKRPIWVKIEDFFLAVWPWNLTDDLENQMDTAPKQYQSLCIISSPYVKSNWSYGPETANLFVFLHL